MDLDDDELRATRKMHGQDDGLYEETSDKNVVSEDDMEELYDVLLHHRETEEVRIAIKHLLEENKKLKAAHIFTRNNNATDEEKAQLYDVIDNTIDTFLEQENSKWEQIMTTNKMSIDEAIDIVDAMYQNRYKAIEKNNTISVNKLDDIKFTNLEFASVRLLRELQSLQSKLENSIPKQKVKDKIKSHKNYLLNQAITSNPTLDSHFRANEKYVIQTLQELLEGEKHVN